MEDYGTRRIFIKIRQKLDERERENEQEQEPEPVV